MSSLQAFPHPQLWILIPKQLTLVSQVLIFHRHQWILFQKTHSAQVSDDPPPPNSFQEMPQQEHAIPLQQQELPTKDQSPVPNSSPLAQEIAPNHAVHPQSSDPNSCASSCSA